MPWVFISPLWKCGKRQTDTNLVHRQTPPFQHCLHTIDLNSDWDYLVIFRCKHSQLPDAQCHVKMACNPWWETWYVAVIYTGGTRICVIIQWMSVDRMTLSPAKLNLIWTATVNLRVMTGKPQTQKLKYFKYYQCTPAAILCYQNTQLFNWK